MTFWNSPEFKKDLISLVEGIKGLDLVLEIANKSGIRYCLFGGAYLALATRNQAELTGINFLTDTNGINQLGHRFPQAVFKESQPEFSTQFFYPLGHGLVEFAADIEMFCNQNKYRFYLTDLVWRYTQRVVVGNYQLYLISPIEMVLFKAVLQRGPDQGEQDLEDIKNLLEFTYIHKNYLYPRLEEINADQRVFNCLARFGIPVPVES